MKDFWVLGPASRDGWQEMTRVQAWTSEEARAEKTRGEHMALLQGRERPSGATKRRHTLYAF